MTATAKRHLRSIRVGLSFTFSTFLLACTPDAPPRPPETPEARTSYAIGVHFGMRLRLMRAGLDPEQIVAGFSAGIAGSPRVETTTAESAVPAALAVDGASAIAARRELDAEEIRLELARLAESTRESARTARAELARRNERAGAAFLAANRTQPGVIELPSGVQYRIVIEGNEPPPSMRDRLTVEYEGRLLDGAVFDTSRDRFAPTIVRLQRTPQAWRDVAPRVPGGSTVEMWVPGTVASDEHPVGLIPPGEAVVFTLRLVALDRHSKPDVARAPPLTAP